MAISVLKRIESLRVRNSANKLAINKDLYRLLCNPELLGFAYQSIKSNVGNMTPGTDNETLDGYSPVIVEKVIRDLKTQSYQFKPVRRVTIPKGTTGKTRPLGVPSPRDKVVQKGMITILEAVYEPTFSRHSHGFRKGFSCHSALKEFRDVWSGIKWGIEGDIKGCYDNVDHHILIDILRKKIQDERFLQLIWKLLRAGVLEKGVYSPSNLGTPQGGILSPILANIYLNEFDEFVEDQCLKYNIGTTRRANPEYPKLRGKRDRLKKKRTPTGSIPRDPTTIPQDVIKALSKEMRRLPSKDPFDTGYVRIRFIRYADDWIIGVIGPKELAVKLRIEVEEFFQKTLKLTLSPEKTRITYMPSGKAQFLGFQLECGGTSSYCPIKNPLKRRSVGWQPRLMVPMESIIKKLAAKNFCSLEGLAVRKKGWIHYPDEIIIRKYNYVIRGLRNYYSPADNLGTSMNRIIYILKYSCAHTLASKHRTRISIQINRMKELGLDISHSKVNPLDFKINYAGSADSPFKSYVERTQILSSTHCLICNATYQLEMHHVKTLRKDGVCLTDRYMIAVMQRMNRKQITVCKKCHVDIHNGKYDGISLSLLE